MTAGFNLVMPADPAAPADDYARRVRDLVDYARPRDVAVEAELGELPAGVPGFAHGEGAKTDPDGARDFVRATGVDLLAVSVGNVHVSLSGRMALDLDRLMAIRRAVDVPLVLHGGTGIADEFAARGDCDRRRQSELRDDPQTTLPRGGSARAGDRRTESARPSRHGRSGGRDDRRASRGARGRARTPARAGLRREGVMVRVGCAGILVADMLCGPVEALPQPGELLAVDDIPRQGGRVRGECRDRSLPPAHRRCGCGLRRSRRRRRDAARRIARAWRRLRRHRPVRSSPDQQDCRSARRRPGSSLHPRLRRQCGVQRRPHPARMAERAQRLLSRRPFRHAGDQGRRARRPSRLLPPVGHRHRRDRGRAQAVRPSIATSRSSCR